MLSCTFPRTADPGHVLKCATGELVALAQPTTHS